jgi:hypothetical protein
MLVVDFIKYNIDAIGWGGSRGNRACLLFVEMIHNWKDVPNCVTLIFELDMAHKE